MSAVYPLPPRYVLQGTGAPNPRVIAIEREEGAGADGDERWWYVVINARHLPERIEAGYGRWLVDSPVAWEPA